jgi:hypothetical protein
LEAGWGVSSFTMSAHILRSMYSEEWVKKQVEQKYCQFVDSLLMSQLKHFDDPKTGVLRGPVGRGNWGYFFIVFSNRLLELQ